MSKNLLLTLLLVWGIVCQTEVCAQEGRDSVWGESTFPRSQPSSRSQQPSAYGARSASSGGNGAGLGNTTRSLKEPAQRDGGIVATKGPARPTVGSVPRQPNPSFHAQPNMAVNATYEEDSTPREERVQGGQESFAARPESAIRNNRREVAASATEDVETSEASTKGKPGALRLAAPTSAPGKATRSGSTATTSSNAIGTTLGSLAIVLGVFFAVSWLCRKLSPAASGPLPKEVLELLGRTSMGGRQQLQLLRLGNKLVLVAVTAAGMETISEVHDEAEVERLVQMCKRQQPGSVSGSFLDLVNQIEKTPILAGFVDRGKSKSTSGERGGV